MSSFFIPKKVRITLDNVKKCAYCGGYANTIDHIYPRSKGGDNNIKNLTKSCAKCNSYKNDFTVDTFLERIQLKRIYGFNRFHYYSKKLRRLRKNNTNELLQYKIEEKIQTIKNENKYFSKVINSLLNEDYIIF